MMIYPFGPGMSRRFEKAQLIASGIAVLIGIVTILYQNYEKEQLRKQNLTYDKQLEVLSQVQSSIDNLKDFVIAQKKQLQEQQAALDGLKNEKEKLRPIVEADRQTIEALFRIQAERNRSTVWTDRFIGFFFGIAGSLIASLIWSFFRSRRSDKALKTPTAPVV